MFRVVSPDDELRHRPENDDILWQESFCLAWFDPVSGFGGFHHAGLQDNRGEADAWSWIAKDGKVIHKYHCNTLDLPAGSFDRLAIGPFNLEMREPLTHRHFAINDRGFKSDLDYAAWSDTLGASYDGGGASMGRGHWENFGRVTGTVQYEGQTFDVQGFAFQDRSWGNRDWSKVMTYRWNWASFGEDLIFSLYNVTGVDGSTMFGHVFDQGRWDEVRAVNITTEMSNDGVSPTGGRAEIWTKDGRGYKLRARCSGSSVQIHRDNFMMSNACTTYELGGRLGAGFMEIMELKAPNASLRAVLDAADPTTRKPPANNG